MAERTDEALCLRPPEVEWVPKLLALFKLWDKHHGEGPWARDLARRLGSGQSGSEDRFYVSPHGQKVAAALDVTWSTEAPKLGLVHRVFTHPKMRRKKLAAKLIERAQADFRAAGGRVLLVIAPSTGKARTFYESMGFREVITARDGEIMLGWAARGRHVREAVLRFLRRKPVRFRPAEPGDWAYLAAWSALADGRHSETPPSLLDVEWAELLERVTLQSLAAKPPPRGGIALEVGVSREGHIVAVRGGGALPAWVTPMIAPAPGARKTS